MAHACGFYSAYEEDFPAASQPAQHLDYFVIWYTCQVLIRRFPRKPQLDNTLRQLPSRDVLRLVRDMLEEANEIARCNQGIITPQNFRNLQRLSPIAAADAKPDGPAQAEFNDTIC